MYNPLFCLVVGTGVWVGIFLFLTTDENNIFFDILLSCGEQQTVQNVFLLWDFHYSSYQSVSDNTFKKTSSFVIAKTLHREFSDVRFIKHLHSGDLLIDVPSANQSEILSKCKNISPFSVSVQVH